LTVIEFLELSRQRKDLDVNTLHLTTMTDLGSKKSQATHFVASKEKPSKEDDLEQQLMFLQFNASTGSAVSGFTGIAMIFHFLAMPYFTEYKWLALLSWLLIDVILGCSVLGCFVLLALSQFATFLWAKRAYLQFFLRFQAQKPKDGKQGVDVVV